MIHAVTRADYARLMERLADAQSPTHLRWTKGWHAEAGVVGRGTVDYGLMEACLALRHGQTKRAARAKQVLLAVNTCVLEGTEEARLGQFRQMDFCLYSTTLL